MDVYRALSGLIDNSTSENLNAPDMNAMREVSEVVCSRADMHKLSCSLSLLSIILFIINLMHMIQIGYECLYFRSKSGSRIYLKKKFQKQNMPKEAIKQIHNKLMKKDKKVTMLCLELLEYLTYSCEMTLYNQIATKEFMMRLGSLLKSHDSDDLVKKRVCCLIKCWRDVFYKDIQVLFFQFYESVVQKGFEIPSNYVSPYAHLKGGNGVSKFTSSTQSIASNSTTTSQNKDQTNQIQIKQTNISSNGPKSNIKNEFENIKQNVASLNEMIDNQDPKNNVDQNSAINNLIKTLKEQQKNMESLIEKLMNENDEQLLDQGFKLTEDIESTFQRHLSLKRHMQPKPFKGKVVESKKSVVVNDENKPQNHANIFSETAQALSLGLARAQGTKVLPPPQNFKPIATQQQPLATVQQTVVSQQQQPQPIKQTQTNILDLFDDEPSISIPQKPVIQNPPTSNNDKKVQPSQN